MQAELEAFIRGRAGHRLGHAPLTRETPLFGPQGLLESLVILELVVWLEERQGVVVEAMDIHPEHFGTLGRLLDFLGGRQQA